jgi:hypothetical protein
MTGPTGPDAAKPPDELTGVAALQARLGVMDGLDDFDEMRGPTYWPTLPADEAEAEWDSLRRWVEGFRSRFPHAVKIPDCWFMHGDLAEALSALRDHERASFSSTAPPTAAVEWHRACREMEVRMEGWIKRFTCTIPGRGHEPAAVSDPPPAGWDEFVRSDVSTRSARQIAVALS